jgi:hypothetical protein
MTPKPFVPALTLAAFVAAPLHASSHREAPFVTENPKVDATDFYMFRSYEPGREGFVTLVANYLPLQDPYGGPNYFFLDPQARYNIHIDNDGDAIEDLTFSFQVQNALRDIQLNIGGQMVSVPLINVGPIGPDADDNGALNILETYSVELRLGADMTGAPLVNAGDGSATFAKPVDNIGTKSIPDYEAYAAAHVYDVVIPGCATPGRMFVGQRKDPFVVNLGEVFDLVNTNPLGPPDGEEDQLADANVTSFILEVPIECLLADSEGDGLASSDPVIGGWTTATLPRLRRLRGNPSFDGPALEGGPHVQVSRLGMPLVNEVVIGIKDKDRFNASEPARDGQFLTYVTNPTLPALLQVLFGVTPPCLPRNDLVAVFLTGVPGLNQPIGVVPSEMLRLNTSTPPVPKGMQSNLGVLGGDVAGFPNGRRPGDDVVDIELRAVIGILYPDAGEPKGCAPSGLLPLTDGAIVSDAMFGDSFPYLATPLPGAPSN